MKCIGNIGHLRVKCYGNRNLRTKIPNEVLLISRKYFIKLGIALKIQRRKIKELWMSKGGESGGVWFFRTLFGLYSFNMHELSTYFILSSVPGTENSLVNNRLKSLSPKNSLSGESLGERREGGYGET